MSYAVKISIIMCILNQKSVLLDNSKLCSTTDSSPAVVAVWPHLHTVWSRR